MSALHDFHIVRFDSSMNRNSFDCGVMPLNRYFKEQVSQDIRRNVTACYVLLDGQTIAGYYTLASSSVPMLELSESERKKLPRYDSIPAFRMGRLAVDKAYQGLQLGVALLTDALQRCNRAEVGVYALVVDAKDAKAAAFYVRHGFMPLPQSPLTLVYRISQPSIKL